MKHVESATPSLCHDAPAQPVLLHSTKSGGLTAAFAVSAASYLAITALVIAAVYSLNHAQFTYALDDAYIHLALARNWLRWHSIGLSPGQSAMASSSPLWSLVLVASLKLFGLRELLPLVLNIFASLATLAVFWWAVSRLQPSAAGLDGRAKWLAIALPCLLNLVALSIGGMEATTQLALVLAYAVLALSLLGQTPVRRRTLASACLLSCLLVLVRLESVLLIGSSAWLLWWRGKRVPALLLLATAGVTLGTIALAVHSQTGFYMPNSVVAKGMPANLSTLRYKLLLTSWGLLCNPLLLLTLVASLALRRGQPSVIRDGLSVLFLTAILHLVLSSVSGTFALDRYESYLIDLGVLLIVCADWRALRARFAGFFKVLAAAGLVEKLALIVMAALGSNDVYLQHFQLGRLIQQEFPSANLVVNDVGMVALRAGGNITDLVGLGSTDLLRVVRKSGEYTAMDHRSIDPLLDRDGADLIAIYPDWFSSRLYGDWTPVAAWTLPRHQATAGGPTVMFFARTQAQAPAVRRKLEAFEPQLPQELRVRYAGRDFAPDADLSAL